MEDPEFFKGKVHGVVATGIASHEVHVTLLLLCPIKGNFIIDRVHDVAAIAEGAVVDMLVYEIPLVEVGLVGHGDALLSPTALEKTKRPPGPNSTREGVWIR
jgi:hypothetical protein